MRTTPFRATSFTPFFLAFGAKTVLPTKLEYGSPRTDAYNDEQATMEVQLYVNVLDEARDEVIVRS